MLIADVKGLCDQKRIRCRSISRPSIQQAFAEIGVKTKYEIAGAIASRFPELSSRLPHQRKPWESEDERMSIFSAAAMALTVCGLAGEGLRE